MGLGWFFWIGKIKNPLRVLSAYSIFAQVIALILYSLLKVVINETEMHYINLVLASPLDYWFVLIYMCNALILITVFSSKRTWSLAVTNRGNNLIGLLTGINMILSFGIMISFVRTTERQVIVYNLDDYVFIMSMTAGISTTLPQLFFLQLLGGETMSEEQKNQLLSHGNFLGRIVLIFQEKNDKLLKRLVKEGKVEIKKPKKNKPYEKGSLRYYLAWAFIIGLFAAFIGLQYWAFLDIIYRGWLLQPVVWIGALFWSICGYLIPAQKRREGKVFLVLTMLTMIFIAKVNPIGFQLIVNVFLFFIGMILKILVEMRKEKRPSWL